MFRILITFILTAALCGPTQAAVFAVDDDTDAPDVAPGDGSCATAAGTCSLRAAIQETNALDGADEIDLPVGFFTLTIPGTDEDAGATGDLDVLDDLTIRGVNAYLSIIDAGGIDRVIDQLPQPVASQTTTLQLEDLTIANGDAQGTGGGIRYGAMLVLDRVIVRENEASFDGGGLGSTNTPFDEPSLIVRASIISLNFAGNEGGGIHGLFTEAVTIERTTIVANTAQDWGGGIGLTHGSSGSEAMLSELTIYGNSVSGPSFFMIGGGLRVSGARIDRSWIGHNRTGVWGSDDPGSDQAKGGGIHGTAVVITNSTLQGNFSRQGGAISNSNSIELNHVTIAGNAATDNGGGLYQFGLGSDTTFQNTIIAGNSPRNCDGQLANSAGHNLADDDTCNLTQPTDLVDVDPGLGALGDHGGLTRTLPLMAGSQAIDAGTDAGLDVDQRGVARPQGDGYDIGAFEFDGRKIEVAGPCDRDGDGRVDVSDLDSLTTVARLVSKNNYRRSDRSSYENSYGRDVVSLLGRCVKLCTRVGCGTAGILDPVAVR